METLLLIIHLIIALALVGVILLQRSEGGALGIGGAAGGGMGGMFSARGTANLLTRTTAILAVMFITTSLLLAIVSGRYGDESSSGITEQLQQVPETSESEPLVPFGQ